MERRMWYARELTEDQDGVRFTGPVPGSRVVIIADEHNVVGGMFYQKHESEAFFGFRLDADGDTIPAAAESIEALLLGVRDAFRDDARERSARVN